MNDREIAKEKYGIDKKHGFYGVLMSCMKKSRQDEREKIRLGIQSGTITIRWKWCEEEGRSKVFLEDLEEKMKKYASCTAPLGKQCSKHCVIHKEEKI
jgi:hypothetical protein